MIPAWAIGALGGISFVLTVGIVSYDMGKDAAEAECATTIQELKNAHANAMAEIQFRIDDADKKAGEAIQLAAGKTSTYREKTIEHYKIVADPECLPLDRVQHLAGAQRDILRKADSEPTGERADPVQLHPDSVEKPQ